MSQTLVDFNDTTWTSMGPGARHKVVERSGKRIRLVEFTDVFVEEDWCLKGHVGYMLEGDLEITFADHAIRVATGDAFVIRGGGVEKHKARALGSAARFILVEDG